ncbi:high-affinity nicotinic acid transporter [Coprinopsis cinerea AmutBmut pab1-1]|nr:high-affinity nicotinic acid transporter [Coprinopsis cinerea AmutBmut pab1-1]
MSAPDSNPPDEKDEKLEVEVQSSTKSSVESQSPVENKVSEGLTDEERELVRRAKLKLDLTLMPVMAMFNFLGYLDRTNIGNARIAGMQSDLSLTDKQFSIAIAVFYGPYILSELPSNLVLKKIGPNFLLPAVLTGWGIVVLAQGFVKNYGGLLAIRLVLGLLEGPMFPGIVLYLSGFYTRKELSLRIAYFASSASVGGAFSGLLAAGITRMHGKSGLPGWRWIFIIEGLITLVVGLIGFFLVPANPEKSRVLSPAEKKAVAKLLEMDRPPIGADEKFNPKEIVRSITSPHVFFVFVVFILGGSIYNGLAVFVPTIINDLDFTANESQLLSVGPFAVAFVVSIIGSWISDRFNRRGPPLIVLATILTIGWVIFYVSQNNWLSYASFFFMVPGIYACTPIAAAWLSNNSEPYFRRATSIAFAFMATNVGGIFSTTQFPRKDAPRYRTATITNLTFSVIITLSAATNMLLLRWMDSRKARNRDKILAPFINESDSDGTGKEAWLELGDKHPDFKYTL